MKGDAAINDQSGLGEKSGGSGVTGWLRAVPGLGSALGKSRDAGPGSAPGLGQGIGKAAGKTLAAGRGSALGLGQAAGKTLADALNLAKRERDGMLVLMMAAILLLWVPEWSRGRLEQRYASWWEALPEQTRLWLDSLHQEYRLPDTLYEFDPNTLLAEDWMRLGLGATTAGRLERYLGAGGRFREPEDVLKIYGFREADFERLSAWMKIEEGSWVADRNRGSDRSYGAGSATGSAAGSGYSKAYRGSERGRDPPVLGGTESRRSKQVYTGPMLEINRAGAAEWEAFPGIGSTFAARIIRFRDRLGGFYQVEQLAEVYGLDSAVFAGMRPFLFCEEPVRRLAINRSPLDSLKGHPYIAPWVAEQIVQYRKKHQGFLNLDELRKLRAVNDSVFQRISPYLELGQFLEP